MNKLFPIVSHDITCGAPFQLNKSNIFQLRGSNQHILRNPVLAHYATEDATMLYLRTAAVIFHEMKEKNGGINILYPR